MIRRKIGELFASIALIVGAWMTSSTAQATVTIEKSEFQFRVNILGTITKADAKEIAQLENDFAYRTGLLLVNLNSSGGDLDAAMAIGRIIRKSNGLIIVGAGAKCLSSCSLIYIAGVDRGVSVDGVVGLHRPYFASAPQTRQTVEREAPLMLKTLKEYVAEMGIQDRFYQVTVNTDPSEMKLYGLALFGYRDIQALIPPTDSTFDEIETNYAAREHGINTVEMRVRKARAKKECSIEKIECQWAMEWGLSEDLYRQRRSQTQKCFIDQNQVSKVLNAVKAIERPDHPLYLKRETCVRDIMLAR